MSDFESEREIADEIGIPVAKRHIFLCCDQTKPKCCDRDRGMEAWHFLKKRLKINENILSEAVPKSPNFDNKINFGEP